MIRPPLLFKFLWSAGLLMTAHSVRAEEPTVVDQTVVVTPSRFEGDSDLGLEILWLPLDSRGSLTDYVGRYVPGALLDASGGLSLRGGRPGDTALEVDGLRLKRMSLPPGMVAELGVSTAGYGAAWSDVLGGIVGVTTKSGSNRVRADAELYAEFREPATAALAGTVSGPIVRDRLFFLISLRGQASQSPGVHDSEGILPDVPDPTSKTQTSGLKLTWLPGAGHRVESLTLVDSTRLDNGAGPGTELVAQPTFEQLDIATSLRWTGRLGEAVTAHSQVGFQSHRAEEMPLQCRANPATCDTIAPTIQKFPRRILSGNWTNHEIQREIDWQVVNGVEARLFERPTVRQRLLASSRLGARQLEWESRTPGDRLFELNGGPEAQSVTFANDPRVEAPRFGWFKSSGSSLLTVHSLESETLLYRRVWLVPGLGLTASQARVGSFTVSEARLTPHLGLAWDVWGNGRTWLHASSHQRADGDLEGLVRFAHPTPLVQKCKWNADTSSFSKECVLAGGFSGTVGLPCGAENVAADGTPCNGSVRLPRAWEHSAGAQHELGLGVRAGVDLVYRRFTALPDVIETNRLWNASGTTGSGYRNGRSQLVFDYSSNESAIDRYLGVTASLTKQAGAFKFLLAYTLSQHKGTTFVADTGLPYPYTSEGGFAADDRTHAIRALASYDLFGFASLGMTFTHDSGAPLLRSFRNTSTGRYEDYRAGVGVDPGTNINDPTGYRPPTRGPARSRLNLQARLRTKRLIGLDFDVYADVIDFFDEHERPPEDTATFIAARQSDGRWVRLGLEYRY
jgi:hypothetical protein